MRFRGVIVWNAEKGFRLRVRIANLSVGARFTISMALEWFLRALRSMSGFEVFTRGWVFLLRNILDLEV